MLALIAFVWGSWFWSTELPSWYIVCGLVLGVVELAIYSLLADTK